MITRPFNFEALVKRPSGKLEVVPLIDVCVIMLFFSILGSRFIVAPGISLSLPVTQGTPVDAVSTAHVLTVMETQGSEILIFETGGILTIESFSKVLAGRKEDYSDQVLLIRADRDVSLQVLTRVWETALDAGFGRVMIAAEPEKVRPEEF